MNPKFERELFNRLVRIESKLVRGFEELGVNIDADSAWLSIDEPSRTVYVSTLGRSVTVLLSDMARAGATQVGKEYNIIHRGDVASKVNASHIGTFTRVDEKLHDNGVRLFVDIRHARHFGKVIALVA